MPTKSTVFKWLLEDSQFSDQYVQACEIDADIEFDSLTEIADNATPRNANVAKLKIETRKWILSKRLPKKYGDFQHLELSTPGGGFHMTVDFVKAKDSDE